MIERLNEKFYNRTDGENIHGVLVRAKFRSLYKIVHSKTLCPNKIDILKLIWLAHNLRILGYKS